MPSAWSYVVLLLALGFAAGEIKNKGWWKNTVFYQVYPRSFMDANNDGIGDLQGITDKLEHFVESGIGAIWLSPIYASPMVDFGYDISDFRDIDEAYGSMQDLEALTKKAKHLGIKVIMDLVPNHTSDKHYWFVQSFNGVGKYKDYYIWREGKSTNSKPPNNWISVFSGPAWTYNATRESWYFHQFEYRQPDLNYANPNVRQEMEEIIRFWLGKGIDGFRVDAVPHIFERDDIPDEPESGAPGVSARDYPYLNHIYTKDDPRTYELVKSWRKILDDWSDSRNEDEKVIMIEAYTSLANTTRYYQYGAHVPFNFNFIMSLNNKSSPIDFKKIIDDWMSSTPSDASANWVMGNHDRSRTATRYPGRADQMTMLAMVLPGVAVTYNGEEIAMEDKLDISWQDTQDPQACNTDPEHYKERTRDPNRTPFQWDATQNSGFSNASKTWLPVHDNYKTLNLAKQKSEAKSHYKLYQALTKLRTTSEALKNGELKTEVMEPNDGTFAVFRRTSTEGVILLINFSDNQTQSVSVHRKPANLNGTVIVSSVGSNIEWGSSVDTSKVVLPPKVSVVLTVKNGAGDRSLTLSFAILIIFSLICQSSNIFYGL